MISSTTAVPQFAGRRLAPLNRGKPEGSKWHRLVIIRRPPTGQSWRYRLMVLACVLVVIVVGQSQQAFLLRAYPRPGSAVPSGR